MMNIHKTKHIFKIFLYIMLMSVAFPVFANSHPKSKTQLVQSHPIEVSAWIPYWRKATGTLEAIGHIGLFSELSPFGYTVKNNGSLYDMMNINSLPWPNLFATAKIHKVKIIPTVMWSSPTAIDTVLRSPALRRAHVHALVDMVMSNNFDGVDIDYEGKDSKTEKYFSFFLRDVQKAFRKAKIGKKILSCTIEARTPLEDRFITPPNDITYANDYGAINTYCDRVRIMTYDQGTIDLTLNTQTSLPYVPVADPQWVEKVIRLAAKTISKKKLVIGVATYGYLYTVTPDNGAYIYERKTSFNPKYALDIASAYGISPTRNSAGEISFLYVPTSTSLTTPTPPSSSTTPSLDTSVFGQNAVTYSTGSPTLRQVKLNTDSAPFRLLWWSDAKAISAKITLAKKLGVRGIVIFKLDGGSDPDIWNVLKK